MQKKADNQKYAEDKPKDCSYCYFGIAGRMDVPKKNAIIGFCRRNLLKRKRRLGAVRDALMEDILLASGTACRRFCWK